MRILHIALLSYFTEGMTYQENYLTDVNLAEGHEVMLISNTAKYTDGKITDTDEEDTVLDNGLHLIRMNYDRIGSRFITDKVQKVRRVRKILDDFAPDSILFHGVCGYELLDVADYVRKHPGVHFYIDCHEDFGNTARTRLAKAAYKYIHGVFVRRALPYAEKVLYIVDESRTYLKAMFPISDDKLELYPLGGYISSQEERECAREHLNKEYSLTDDTIVYMHSGKLVPAKKTAELLRAFRKVPADNIVMFIFGVIPDENRSELMGLIEADERVRFIGWKSGDEITELLNAADVYCQPGSLSATSQVALCCGCTEVVASHIGYTTLYEDSVLYADNEEQLAEQISRLTDRDVLAEYKNRSLSKAKAVLDYKVLAERYLH